MYGGRGSHRHAVHHAWRRVVDLERPVAAGRREHDVGERLRVDAVRLPEPQRLRRAGHQDAEQHVVADLGDLPRAEPARVVHL